MNENTEPDGAEKPLLTITSRQFWEIFFTKLQFNIKSEISTTYLGYLWWILEPVLYIAAMYVVFAIFLRIRTGDFIVFLICGQVAFSWFSRSVGNASRSIVAGKGLINQVYIPKPFFPLLTVCQDFVKQCVVFVAVLAYFLIMDQPMSLNWLSLFAIMAVQFMLIAAVGMMVASIVPAIPDFKFVVSTALMIMMWGSGIFYSYEEVLLPEHRELYLMNPMANLIKNYRQVVLDNQLPDWDALAAIALVSLLLAATMMVVYRRFDSAYARLVTQ